MLKIVFHSLIKYMKKYIILTLIFFIGCTTKNDRINTIFKSNTIDSFYTIIDDKEMYLFFSEKAFVKYDLYHIKSLDLELDDLSIKSFGTVYNSGLNSDEESFIRLPSYVKFRYSAYTGGTLITTFKNDSSLSVGGHNFTKVSPDKSVQVKSKLNKLLNTN